MLNEERIILMTQMASYEQGKVRKMSRSEIISAVIILLCRF